MDPLIAAGSFLGTNALVSIGIIYVLYNVLYKKY